jgi:hypothetical protein
MLAHYMRCLTASFEADMSMLRAMIFGLAVGFAAVRPAVAADLSVCLSPDERRAAIETNRTVSLGRAMHVAKANLPGDVVKARLCRQAAGEAHALVYVLTVLSHNGKVMQARVDAADGHWLGAS